MSKSLKDRYNRLIETVEIGNIRAKKICGELDSDAYEDAIRHEVAGDPDYEIAETTSFRNRGGKIFEVQVDYQIKGKNPLDKRKHLFEFELSYVLIYRAEIEVDRELLDEFLPNVRLNVWPYCREQVQDLSRKLGMASFVLPPFRFGLEEN